jgi:uncharacterized membrane protein YecN with MAPEG domain
LRNSLFGSLAATTHLQQGYDMECIQLVAVFVAANALVLWVLTVNVSRLRLRYQISVGDGGNKDLFVAIRAHANGVEQVPVFSILILIAAFLNANCWFIGISASVFTVARVLHAVGMLKQVYIARRISAGLTYLVQIGIIGLVIFYSF